MLLSYLIAVGVLLGAADYLLKNRFHIGEQFEEGILCLGKMTFNMAGIICVSPLLGSVFSPVMEQVYALSGVDPSVLGMLLANNMGGHPLAVSLAKNEVLGQYFGLVVSSMLGAAFVYTIPVGLSLMEERYHALFAKGVMIGLIPIPVGSFLAGIMMGIPLPVLVCNTLPLVFIGGGIFLGFLWRPKVILRIFVMFAGLIKWITVVGLAVSAFTYLTEIELLPDLIPLPEAMNMVGAMCIVQMGSIPLAVLFVRAFQKPLGSIGRKLGINAEAAGAFPIACVNASAVFLMVKRMDPRGIILTSAWTTSAICLFSAHYSFTALADPNMVAPVIMAKTVSAVLALILAILITRREENGNMQQ